MSTLIVRPTLSTGIQNWRNDAKLSTLHICVDSTG